MKCAKCDATVHTVGDVRRCGGCQDQTAQQIPGDMNDGSPIEDAIAVKEGLGNRFKAGGDPRPEPEAEPQGEPQADPEVAQAAEHEAEHQAAAGETAEAAPQDATNTTPAEAPGNAE